MKIIQPGIEDMQNQMRIKCNICEAIFDISTDDIEKEDGVRSYYTTCPNPACKRIFKLYEGSIPRNILWKVNLRETK